MAMPLKAGSFLLVTFPAGLGCPGGVPTQDPTIEKVNREGEGKSCQPNGDEANAGVVKEKKNQQTRFRFKQYPPGKKGGKAT